MRVNINGVPLGPWPVSTDFLQIDADHWIPHRGIDFAIDSGTPVPSVGDGVVTSLTDEGAKSFGRAVHMHLNDGSDIVYGHMSAFQVHTGEYIHRGDIVGLSGSTGDATGPHLHLAAIQNGLYIDPSPYAQSVGIMKGNGVGDMVANKIGDLIREFASSVIHLLNNNSAEIITLGLVICGGMMMIAPLIGSTSGKWFGRAMGTLWIGAIWRVVT